MRPLCTGAAAPAFSADVTFIQVTGGDLELRRDLVSVVALTPAIIRAATGYFRCSRNPLEGR
jgi:hypothetical protein